MPRTVISVENLSKYYRLGVIGGATFREEFSRFWARKLGRPDPWARIGQPDHGNRDGEHIWALRDVNLEVEEGEILGIIGRNGAGKSTLLKILSRITAPTSGRAVIRGRVGSLLEVGTGFHPELTGRENIYLNGTILGMTRAEVTRKLDEIVEFAEIGPFVDTPVKRYSSGMTVRLAFAVAAHLEPEILIVDEVLAVGDAAFRKKCLGKMGHVAREGRTILFVSHELGAVRQICTEACVMAEGRVTFKGTPEDSIGRYLQLKGAQQGAEITDIRLSGPCAHLLDIERLEIRQRAMKVNEVDPGYPFEVTAKVTLKATVEQSAIMLGLSHNGERLLSVHDIPQFARAGPGKFSSRFEFPAYFLRPGRFELGVGLRNGHSGWAWSGPCAELLVLEHWDDHLRKIDEGLINSAVLGYRESRQ